MFKNFFGPFPDEPLLYSIDKILGLFHQFDSTKLKCKDGGKQQIDASVDTKIGEVINETATANIVTDEVVITESDLTDGAVTTENHVTSLTVTEKVSMEIVKTSSYTSKRSTVESMSDIKSVKVSQEIKLPPSPKPISAPKSILKTTSSMECNYPLSKICITKKSLHTNPVPSAKKTNRYKKSSTKRYTQTKGFGDSVTVVQDKFEKKLFRSDGKNRYEAILKQETKQQRKIPSTSPNRLERPGNRIHNELASHPQKAIKNVKVKDRKVTKTEWAVTRIYTFDDDSQTYEVMKKDKVLDRNGGVERIFAMAPNLTTVAYDPLKRDDKKR